MLKNLLLLGILCIILGGCFSSAILEGETEYTGSIYYDGAQYYGWYDYNMGFIWYPGVRYYPHRHDVVVYPRRHRVSPGIHNPSPRIRYSPRPNTGIHNPGLPPPPQRYGRERIGPPPSHNNTPPAIRGERSAPPSNQGRSSQGNDNGRNGSPNNSNRSEGRGK